MDKIVWKILLDFILMLCIAFSLLAIELWMEPYRRGFFEDDLSIRLPYKEQSVTEVMTATGAILVILTILIIEVVTDRQGRGIGDRFVCDRLVPGWLWQSYCTVGVFLFGLAAQHLLTFISKSVIGRLRPNFYDVCMPVYNASDPLNLHGYIQHYACSQPDERLLSEAHMSFPSGHASYSMCCAVFFICYVQVKGKWHGSALLRHCFQLLVLLAAWYVALTRVQEHYHFWSDVAVGGAIGGAVAVTMFNYILKPTTYIGHGDGAWNQESTPQNTLPRPVLAR